MRFTICDRNVVSDERQVMRTAPVASDLFPRPALCAGRGPRRGALISQQTFLNTSSPPTRLEERMTMRTPSDCDLSPVTCRAFTLVEVMVAMGILSLIVLVLMAVFSNTQSAFRASVTSSDILENGRATMELMTSDLRAMAPSDGFSLGNSNALTASGTAFNNYPVNFYVMNNAAAYYLPMAQPLIGSATGATRTNLLQYFFILGRQNTLWTGVGYFVNTNADGGNSLYPLYRFSAQTNVENSPATLFNLFQTELAADLSSNNWANMSHLMNGVVGLTVRTYDLNGVWLTNGYVSLTNLTLTNAWFTAPYPALGGEMGCAFFSNALPASVEVQLATLEDRTMQKAQSMSYNPGLELGYLTNHVNAVHVFRQRVSIPQVDPSAYQ
jgi:prepilin-type N-terminal cleavage/methylation domain-containing protein